MDTLAEIVRNIIALVLVFSCLELFIPSGELSRFVRLSFGFILLAMIIIPIATSIDDVKWQESTLDYSPDNTTNYIDTSEQISDLMEDVAKKEYERETAQHIASIAMLTDGVVAAEANITAESESGAIKQAKLLITKKTGAQEDQLYNKITALMNSFFGLTKDQITIDFQGEGEN